MTLDQTIQHLDQLVREREDAKRRLASLTVDGMLRELADQAVPVRIREDVGTLRRAVGVLRVLRHVVGVPGDFELPDVLDPSPGALTELFHRVQDLCVEDTARPPENTEEN